MEWLGLNVRRVQRKNYTKGEDRKGKEREGGKRNQASALSDQIRHAT